MNVADAMRKRHSCRAFLDQEVDLNKIKRILGLARRTPSGANTQPWRVAVVTGQPMREIQHKMEDEFRAGNRGKPDYKYYPVQWTNPYKIRRFACGAQLYAALGIGREDKKRRVEQWIENYRSFGAPVVLYFYMESHLEAGAYMDLGMFIQTVMLLAEEEGLATCPQQALAQYPEIVKHTLGIEDGSVLLCGMALGYEDPSAPINHIVRPGPSSRSSLPFTPRQVVFSFLQVIKQLRPVSRDANVVVNAFSCWQPSHGCPGAQPQVYTARIMQTVFSEGRLD